MSFEQYKTVDSCVSACEHGRRKSACICMIRCPLFMVPWVEYLHANQVLVTTCYIGARFGPTGDGPARTDENNGTAWNKKENPRGRRERQQEIPRIRNRESPLRPYLYQSLLHTLFESTCWFAMDHLQVKYTTWYKLPRLSLHVYPCWLFRHVNISTHVEINFNYFGQRMIGGGHPIRLICNHWLIVNL